MKNFSLKTTWQLFPAIVAVSLMAAPPLWSAEESSATQGEQEESVFQAIKRKTGEWVGGDNKTDKANQEAPKQAEPPPQNKDAKESDGRKAINTVKKRMQKASDNISKSVDRDKKILKKKLNKLFEEK